MDNFIPKKCSLEAAPGVLNFVDKKCSHYRASLDTTVNQGGKQKLKLFYVIGKTARTIFLLQHSLLQDDNNSART
jgi:hypothetical protein